MIDNVPEPEPNARPLPLSTWCPALGHVTALATSRMHVHLEGGNIRELSIDVLGPEDSVALLTYGVDQISALTHKQWLTIAEWVGRLSARTGSVAARDEGAIFCQVSYIRWRSNRTRPLRNSTV